MTEIALPETRMLLWQNDAETREVTVSVGPVMLGESGYSCAYLVTGLEREQKGALFGNSREQARRLTVQFVESMLPFWSNGGTLSDPAGVAVKEDETI